MKKLLIILFAALSMTVSAKNGPTDAQLKDFCRNVGFAFRGLDESKQADVFKAEVAKAEATFDITKIKPEQVTLLFETGGPALEKYLTEWILPSLRMCRESSAKEAHNYWKYLPTENPFAPSAEKIDALKALIARKDVSKLMESQPEVAVEILAGVALLKGDKWTENGMVNDVKRLISTSLPTEASQQAVDVFNAAVSSSIDAKDKESLRSQVLAIYEKQLKETTYASKKKRLQKQIDYLNSPFAKGTLIGNKAPELHFNWISGGSEKSLDDFKGKVVLLDFWATKCGPCVASFPEVAELQNHYRDKDVVILGITSVQGYFVDKPNQKTVNTAGHPEQEYELTIPYMEAMGVNWRMAYTQEDVMNPDYGALSIPHVAIIDRQGRVRYNNVTGDNASKIELIDNLLSE